MLDSFRNPKLAAAVYASQGDTDPVLAVSSSMDIGDNPAGQLGTAYVFSNAQQVRLYKNDVFVTALRQSEWTALPHPPFVMDDTIGELLETQERFDKAKADTLRLYGELLQANLWAIHKGDRQVTVQNYYTGEDVTIKLDPRLGGNENAQKYFRDYKKKQTAHTMLQKLLVEGEAEIEYLRTVLYEVESAPGEMALNEIRAELKSQGYLKYYKQRDRKQKPADFLRYTSSDGFEILVGRNNLQNDKLTLHTARGKDLWFHVQKAPGSHCVVMSRGEDIPDTTRQLSLIHI